MISLDMMVDQNSTVRLIDLFLDYALSNKLGFQKEKQKTGRPSFPVRTLLGIYIYGYLHRIRSSRKLANACKINVELMWLINNHQPCYKTIANFRKNNSTAFGNLFKLYRHFCKKLDLYGKETIAIDGSKFRAQNSMKNNYNLKKIDRHLDYIETKEKEYLDQLDQADKQAATDHPESHQRLSDLASRKINYQALKQQLIDSDQTQISTSDPDARALPLHMRIVQVAYNLQSAVDDKHNLIVDYDVTNKNDHRALSEMAIRSKNALDLRPEQQINVLADKGYHTADELGKCQKENIKTVVAIKRKPKRTDKSKPEHLHKDKFKYNPTTDSYICPNGQKLTKQARYTRKNTSAFDKIHNQKLCM
jgi:transposase